MDGLILVSTHKEDSKGDVISTSGAAGMTDRMVDLVIAIRNARQVPGQGIIVAAYEARVASAGLDPSLGFWARVG